MRTAADVPEVRQLCANFAMTLEGKRVFAIVAIMLVCALIDLLDRTRRLARRVLKDANARRYTWTMDDLFSVPVGTVPQVDPEDGDDQAAFVPELEEDHLGKWVALNARGIVAVADTKEELLQALGAKRRGLSVFRVPATVHIAR